MARQAAFLRAVNVGGRGIVRMADVQRAFADAGCTAVATVIASGNIIFDPPAPGMSAALDRRIRRNLAGFLGGEPVVIYRSLAALRRLVARAPFGALADDPALKIYVLFALEQTAARPRFPLRLPKECLEAIGMSGNDVFVVSRRKPTGWYGFPTLWIEKELRITTTARSWSTVTRMVAGEEPGRQLPTTNSQPPKLA